MQYRTLPKIWVGAFLVRNVHLKEKTELILTAQLETRHPEDGQFCSEFSVICNHYGIMTAWSRKIWKLWAIILFFFGKRTPYGKIFKILFGEFSRPRRSSTLLCSNFVKVIRREIGVIVRYLLDQQNKNKTSAASQTVVTSRIALKFCQGQPPIITHRITHRTGLPSKAG